MLTRILNKKSFGKVTVPVGTSTTDLVIDMPTMHTESAMDLQQGPMIDYVKLQFVVTGTMPAASVFLTQYYAGNSCDRLLGTTTTGALGAYTNTNATISQTHALIKSADHVKATFQCKQTTTAYIVEAFVMTEEIVYPTAAEDLVGNINISIGTEALDAIPVTVQCYDEHGAALAERVLVQAWLSSDANGTTVQAVTSDTIADGTIISEPVAHGVWTILTSATGAFTLSPLIAGAATRYLTVSINGKKWTSAVITFAA